VFLLARVTTAGSIHAVCLTAEIRFMLFALPQESIHAVCITAEEGGFSRPLKALKSLGL
jgi:hypothetical protein